MRPKVQFRLLTILLLWTITACTKTNQDKAERINDSEFAEPQSTVATGPYFKLGENLEDFKSHFNSFSTKCGSELRLTNFQTNTESEYNTFEYSFNKDLKIIGQLNKSDNSIHAMNVTIASYKNNVSGISDFIVVTGSILDYIDPKLDRMQILDDLKFDKNFDPNNFPTNIARNGIEYTILGDYQEISFIASDPKD